MGQCRLAALLGSSSTATKIKWRQHLFLILLLWLLSLILTAAGATRSGAGGGISPLSHNNQLGNHINHIASPRHFHSSSSNHIIPDSSSSSKDEAAFKGSSSSLSPSHNKPPPSQQLQQLQQQQHNHHLHTSSSAPVNGTTSASVVSSSSSSPSSLQSHSSHSHHHPHHPYPKPGSPVAPDHHADASGGGLPVVPEVLEEKVYHNGVEHILKVLNLNTWGLSWPWSEDRAARFRALKDIIALSNYDIILLQEVWYRADYETIRSSIPYITHFESFNTGCSGYFLPLECSGLTILSRHPIEQVEFRPFSFRGSFWNFDGEIFVEKGVGRARVRWKGLSVDVFTSHMVSYTNNPNSDNNYFRFVQSMETARYIRSTDADIKIFGGDINALPLSGSRQPYTILTGALTDALTDRYPDASFHPWFATFGNVRNTYTGTDCPERIDYLMYSARPGKVHMRTKEFVMPMFMTKNGKGELISLSDHEALLAEFSVIVDPAYVSGNGKVGNTDGRLPSGATGARGLNSAIVHSNSNNKIDASNSALVQDSGHVDNHL